MPRFVPAVAMLLGLSLPSLVGCAGPNGDAAVEKDFRPTRLRLHPTFTKVSDWTSDKKVDGIEVVVELIDGYDDPTKGRGTLLFELWDYRKYEPNIMGKRVADPWRVTLLTRDEQLTRWNRTLRAYTCQLPIAKVSQGRDYVLTASFTPSDEKAEANGDRLFDKLILEADPAKREEEPGVKSAGGSKRGK